MREADVYVLLLGEKYGDPLDDSGRSPTEEEFTVAQQEDKRILVFRKEGGERERAQENFEARVGDYKVGLFWGTFTDALALGPAVLAALNALPAQSPPLTWSPLPTAPGIRWSADRPLPARQQLTAPVLEAHLLPTGPATTLMPVGALPQLAEKLATQGRRDGLFTQRDPLVIDHDSESAWAVRPSELWRDNGFTSRTLDLYAGLVVDRDGGALAFHALPTDAFGALVDQGEMQRRLTILLLALIPWIREDAGRVALAAAINPVDQVFEGDPQQVGHRSQGSLRMATGQAVRADPHDCVALPSLAAATAEGADELAARLIQALRTARR